MSNIRKLTRSLDTSHLTAAEKARRLRAESYISRDITDLCDVTADMFVNQCAKKEYRRMLRALQQADIPVNNLNRADLLVYANSYAMYVDLIELSKSAELTITVGKTEKPNPVFRMMGDAARAMQSAAMHLGVTPGVMKGIERKEPTLEAFNDI